MKIFKDVREVNLVKLTFHHNVDTPETTDKVSRGLKIAITFLV